jgi:hypothetical integral membrane protein (TIGR02206 family)
MTPFGGEHLLLIGLFLVGAVVVVAVGRRQRESDPVRFRRTFAVVMVVVPVASQVIQLMPAEFELRSSLPLQLCDFAWVTAAWALWTRARLPAAITYYWGLTLTVQAIITPSLEQRFPDPLFIGFWAVHILVVWAALYVSIGLGWGPGWREYRLSVLVSLAWLVVAYAFDVAFDTNYGYLQHKPSSGSAFDLLGPWPRYVVNAFVVVLVGWALITLPWTRRTPTTAG